MSLSLNHVGGGLKGDIGGDSGGKLAGESAMMNGRCSGVVMWRFKLD